MGCSCVEGDLLEESHGQLGRKAHLMCVLSRGQRPPRDRSRVSTGIQCCTGDVFSCAVIHSNKGLSTAHNTMLMMRKGRVEEAAAAEEKILCAIIKLSVWQ